MAQRQDKLEDNLAKDSWVTYQQLTRAQDEAKRLKKSTYAALIKIGAYE